MANSPPRLRTNRGRLRRVHPVRRALLALALGGPLVLAALLWAAPRALRGHDPVLVCQVLALRDGWGYEVDGDPWAGPWSSTSIQVRGRFVTTFFSPGRPDGAFHTADDVWLDQPADLYPLAAHLLSLPPLGVAAFSLAFAALALGRRLRGAPPGSLGCTLALPPALFAMPAWGLGYVSAMWFICEPEADVRPWWAWAAHSPLLVSAAWSPLVVWFAGTLLVCHLPDADQRPSVSGSAQ